MLGLNWQRVGTAILADGSQTVFDVYEGTVLWDNQPLLTVVEDGMWALSKAS